MGQVSGPEQNPIVKELAGPVLGDLAADPTVLSCPLLLLSSKEADLSGRNAMEWFKQKSSIAGVQVSNWMIVLGAIIIVLLIVQNFH
jgi:hypothetical protein